MITWRGRATTGELQQPLLSAGAALAISLLPHAFVMPAWISLLAIGCAVYRWQAERRRWRLPATLVRAILAIAALVLILASFRGLNGVEPGSALLAVMAALKLLETHRRRDLFVVLLVATFLTLATLLRDQAVWVFGYLLLAATTIVCAWVQVAREGPVLSYRASLDITRRLLLPAIPLVAAFFVLFPRIPASLWGLPGTGGGSATTGISDTMTPGDISRLVQSNDLVFRARFVSETPTLAQMYWRGPVLETFNGRTWSGRIRRPRAEVFAANDPSEAIDYALTIQPSPQRWLFGLDVVTEVERDATDLNSVNELRSRRPLNNTEVIRMRSIPGSAIREDLNPVVRELLVRTNPERNPRSKAFAKEMRAGLTTDQEFITRVLEMFQDQAFFYTLEPPTLGSNSVDEFLFESRRGFCSHYASAFATLMRAADIPARVVLGYQGGELNPLIGQWQIRQSNAHAWNEVWLPTQGWVRVDPTAAVSAARIAAGLDAALAESGERRSFFAWDMALAERIQLSWDALNARWDEWVLGYGPNTQKAFMEWLGLSNPDWRSLAAMLGAVTVIILGFIALLIRRAYGRQATDSAEHHYRRALRTLGINLPRSASPALIRNAITERYPNIDADARVMIDAYQSLRFANSGSLDGFRASIVNLVGAARRERATTTTPPE